jgi:hypothetical protein
MTDLTFVKPLVQKILEWPSNHQWSVQGFGFLRTYFGPCGNEKRFRLNLWDSRFTVPNVSTIHDHPWDFKSLIVAGHFVNRRYRVQHPKLTELTDTAPTHSFSTITTGINSTLEKSPIDHCVLEPWDNEYYKPGDTYRQRASEIHETKFMDGAVTLNERVGDTEHARVFWPYGTDWVDAKPREATPEEVRLATASALEWF